LAPLPSGQPSGISDLRLIVRNNENDIHTLGDLASGKKKLVPIHTSVRATPLLITTTRNTLGSNQSATTNGDSLRRTFSKPLLPEVRCGYLSDWRITGVKQSPQSRQASESVGLFPNVCLYKKNADPKLIKAIDNELAALKRTARSLRCPAKWYDEDVYGLPGAGENVKVNTDWE
jgi:L-cystine transport system substrate-binding protein